MARECGANGDCLFHVLRAALAHMVGVNATMLQVRVCFANSVTNHTVAAFLDCMLEDPRPPAGLRHCHQLLGQNRAQDACDRVRALISTPGTRFQGTDMCLRWMVCYCPVFVQNKLGFLVFSSFGPGYTTEIKTATTEHFILLFNDAARDHWQLAYIHQMYCAVSKTAARKLQNMCS